MAQDTIPWVDQELREVLEKLLQQWEAVQYVEPGWRVYYAHREGCWQVQFAVAGPDGRRRPYTMTEADLALYATGIADAVPDGVGCAARPLADIARQQSCRYLVKARGVWGGDYHYTVDALSEQAAASAAHARHHARVRAGELPEELSWSTPTVEIEPGSDTPAWRVEFSDREGGRHVYEGRAATGRDAVRDAYALHERHVRETGTGCRVDYDARPKVRRQETENL